MIEKILRLVSDDPTILPNEIGELIKNSKYVSSSTTIQTKENVYNIYKIRATLEVSKGNYLPGLQKMLEKMEVTDTKNVSVTYLQFEHFVLLIFCTEDLNTLIGCIYPDSFS
jgi:hypothetical protein